MGVLEVGRTVWYDTLSKWHSLKGPSQNLPIFPNLSWQPYPRQKDFGRKSLNTIWPVCSFTMACMKSWELLRSLYLRGRNPNESCKLCLDSSVWDLSSRWPQFACCGGPERRRCLNSPSQNQSCEFQVHFGWPRGKSRKIFCQITSPFLFL